MPDVDTIEEGDVSYDEAFDKSPSPGGRRGGSGRENKGGSALVARPGSAGAGAGAGAGSNPNPFKFPVRVPEAALHPSKHPATAAVSNARTRETLIINRSSRGLVALRAADYPSSHAKDFSAFYPTETSRYSKGYLNELAYAETSKKQAAEKKKAADKKAAEEEREARAKYKSGGRKGKAGGGGGGGGGGGSEDGPRDANASLAAFFDRQVAVERRREEGRVEAAEAAGYEANPDKKVCPSCGAVQSFAEWHGGIRKCNKEGCNGAVYRPRLLWSEVQDSFLGRWQSGLKKREVNLAKLEAEVAPPFRVTERLVFNKETGELEKEDIPKQRWEDVAEEFLTRQDEVVTRLAEAAKAAAADRERVFNREKPKLTKYKFAKPLPDFFTRQASAVERRNMTFDERYDALKDL
jgi:hypothetical protein